ncbi:neurogenic locus notch homolog protein 1-like [Microplitis mediator]|uniref:neurogenic locus notch homolog protein 1-like n=1 Tax=Microplitis mediator TaxID=375433 RepID=UPI0025544048|nr:neurogenic locus notch homolog protein 1-like [Microplitis mediator]
MQLNVSKLLGSSCKTDSDCERVEFAKCSRTEICVCSLNTLAVNGTSCVPILNEFCEDNADCKVDNSECFDNKCECKSWFRTIANTECERPHLGMNCRESIDCHVFLDHSECSEEKKCACRHGRYAINNTRCAPAFNEACDYGEICASENSICTNDKCQCKTGYVYQESKCVPKFLGMPCQTEEDCQEIEFSTCSDNNICVCQLNYGGLDLLTCSLLIGADCSKDDDCVAKNSRCFRDKCECMEYHSAHSNALCELTILGHSCQNNEDCRNINHAICSKNKNCDCVSNNIRVNETYCAPALKAFCWKGEKCATDHASCIDDECQCDGNSVQHSNDQCLPKLSGLSCKTDSDCERVKFAKCSKTKVCMCSLNTITVNGTSCVPILNGFCHTNLDCKVDNSECYGDVCECKSMFQAIANTECKKQFLGSPCQTERDCAGIEFSTCSDDNICPLGQFCTTSKPCTIKNSICINNKCQLKVTQVCNGNDDCPGMGQECSNRRCACKDNHIALTSTKCVPVLDGYCSKNKDCYVKNSVCLSNRCQCDFDHLPHSNYECESNCERVKFAKCSRTQICICSSNTLTVNWTSCVPILNGFCQTNADCKVNNSECFDHVCECKSMFQAIANTECKRAHLGMNCRESIDCNNFLDHSECSEENKCACRHGHYAINNTTCAPAFNGACRYGELCAPENSICISHKCQCKPDYVYRGSKCVTKFLGMPCQTERDCQGIEFSTCSDDDICVCKLNYGGPDLLTCSPLIGIKVTQVCNGNGDCPGMGQECSNRRCVCKDNHIALTSTKCVPVLDGYCSKNKDCYVKNSVCLSNRCQCDFDHLPHSNYECESISMEKMCSMDTDCQKIKNSRCSTDHVCACDMNYFAFGKFHCLPTLSGFCLNDIDCYSDSFRCSDNQCQCKSNYTAVSVDKCVENILDSNCTTDSDCNRVKFAECSATKICICSSNTLAVNWTSCVPVLETHCQTDHDCKVDNSECFNNQCKCKLMFKTTSITECKRPHLGMNCRLFTDCDRFLPHSNCSENSECECFRGYYAINNDTCAPGFNVACRNGELCAYENSICIDYKCQCKPDYVYRRSKCVPKFLGMPCQTERDCQEIEFSTCSDDNICVCKLNYGGPDLLTCSPLIGSNCSKNDDCVVQNSYCFLKECRCIENHFAHSNDLCTPVRFSQRCYANADCKSTGHECSNQRCACKDNHIALTSTKCAPVLDGYCSRNKDCYVDNSICVENKCRCDINHLPNSNYECEDIVLNDSCVNNEECSGIKHAKCSKDKLCACIINNIRVNETYCAPALRAFCWKGEKCATDNASCINNECQCDGNSVQQSNDQCLPKLLGSSCETNSDCERVKFSKCSATKTCICSLNTHAVNGTSCVPILHEFCQTNDDCKVENSQCFKNVCKCKSMFKTIANTECKKH